MGLAGYVARTGINTQAYSIFFLENLKGRDLFIYLDPGIGRKIILKLILWK
jgi:hypothetical protein